MSAEMEGPRARMRGLLEGHVFGELTASGVEHDRAMAAAQEIAENAFERIDRQAQATVAQATVSYPDAITDPLPPPTVSGTDVTVQA